MDSDHLKRRRRRGGIIDRSTKSFPGKPGPPTSQRILPENLDVLICATQLKTPAELAASTGQPVRLLHILEFTGKRVIGDVVIRGGHAAADDVDIRAVVRRRDAAVEIKVGATRKDRSRILGAHASAGDRRGGEQARGEETGQQDQESELASYGITEGSGAWL